MRALVASSAIPDLFEPVRRNGCLLVDGGITGNLPIDIAHDLGATPVIAIDIMPLTDGGYEPRDVRDMLLQSWSIVERPTAFALARADVVIAPDVARTSFSDFSQTQVLHEAGVRAAEDALLHLLDVLGPAKAPARSKAEFPVQSTGFE